jgi:hypothetical protein
MFGPRTRPPAPQVLIATDLASEGLDLQGAARVVHYDLPWTPMRLTQRDGRAARLGNPFPSVEIVRFDPPEDIDRRLRQLEILRRKGTLPIRAGVAGSALDRWRALLAGAAGAPGGRGIGLVGWEGRPGLLACVSIQVDAGPRVAGEIAWLDDDGGEVRDPEWLVRALERCLASPGASSIEPGDLRAAQARLATYLRGVLRRGATARWARPSMGTDVRRLARLLGGMARAAARDRDAARMAIVDRALRFTARGHTTGEELMVQELAALSEESLLPRLGDLPASRSLRAADATVVAAVLFQSRPSPLR